METKAPIPADEVRGLLKLAQSIAASVVPEEAEDVAAGVLAELWALGISSPDGRKRWVAKRAKQRALNAKRNTDRRRALLARNQPSEEATAAAVEEEPKTAREVCLAWAVTKLRRAGVADPEPLAADVRKLARYRPSASARRHAEELRRERRRIEALARRYPKAGFKVPLRVELLAPRGRSDRGSSQRSRVLAVICRPALPAAHIRERLPHLTLQTVTALAVLAEPDLFLPTGARKSPTTEGQSAWKRASVNVRSALAPVLDRSHANLPPLSLADCESERLSNIDLNRATRKLWDDYWAREKQRMELFAAGLEAEFRRIEGMAGKFLKPLR